MSEKNQKEPSNAEVLKAWRTLQAAIQRAPSGELRDRIAEDNELHFARARVELRDALSDVEILAKLGDEDAIRELVITGIRVAGFLREFASDEPTDNISDDGQLDSDGNLEEGRESTNWGDQLEQASAVISALGADRIRKVFGDVVSKLPVSEFYFPLKAALIRDSEMEDERYRLVSALCGGLVQERFDAERPAAFREVTASAGIWPVSVSPPEYKLLQGKTVRLQDLRLGEALPIRWIARKEESESAIALEVFAALESERSRKYAPTYLEELRRADEQSPLNELDLLIKTAEDAALSARIGSLETSTEPMVADLELTNAPFADGDDQQVEAPGARSTEASADLEMMATPREYRWENRSWEPTLATLWKRKSALLLPLTKTSAPEWAAAGFAFLASVCDGDFENYEWPEGIATAVGNTGGIKSAVRRVLKKGFQRIAKNQGARTDST